jgi:hypothetical protein
MEFALPSHISSPPRPSSPTHTNSSSATHVEPASFDFFLKKANNSPCLMTSDIGSGSDQSGSPPTPLSPIDEVSNSPVVREGLLHSPSCYRKITSPSHHGKPGHTPAMKESLLCSPSPLKLYCIASPSCRKGHTVYPPCCLSSVPDSPMEPRSSSLPPHLSPLPASHLFGKFTTASPLELHISACASGWECRPEFMAEDIAEVCS